MSQTDELQKIVDKEFEYLLAYPQVKTFAVAIIDYKDDIPADAKTATVTQAINGAEIDEGERAEPEPTLERAIEKTKAYVDSVLESHTVFVRVMPQLQVWDGKYYIRTRFAKFPKEDTECKK